MKFNIITEYPLWFFIFCLITGFLYAYFLYLRSKNKDLSLRFIRILAIFRFLSITILSFLLLSPLFKLTYRYVEKPVIIIAQDNSLSIVTNKDSAFYKTRYIEDINRLADKLSKNYDVKIYTFGDKVSESSQINFKDKQTDISNLFNEITTKYYNRNVGAVILASDGIYNKGESPFFASKKAGYPVYTIALGDTNLQKDIFLQKVSYNKVAYLGNDFPVEIIVRANKSKGEKSTLSVTKDKTEIFSRTIDIGSEIYKETATLRIEAKETGLQHYRISLTPVKKEISQTNNTQDIFIEILDSRQKILLLSSAPHPDVSALKQAIETNLNYQAESYALNKFDKKISGYNLVILHQIPSVSNSTPVILSEIEKAKIPTLFVLGSKSDIRSFNKLISTGLAITVKKNILNEALPLLNSGFALFSISDELRKLLINVPPLQCPFGDYNTSNSVDALCYQKIGSVETKQPLIVFNETDEVKTGVITGEGIWKWRLNDFARQQNHNAFNELVSKMVQYLSVKEDKSLFRITLKSNYYENESVDIDAEVYNESYELINEPDVSITIINEQNKKFPFVFSKTFNAYRLDAGTFPVGIYSYTAQVKVGDKIFQKRGKFSVNALNIETANVLADHNLLYNLSKQHNGGMYYPSQIDELIKAVRNREDVKSISYSKKQFEDIINLKWVLFLIVIFLSAEWFLRKRNGFY